MSAHSWQGSEGLPQPALQDRSLDRQMIRHLLSRYTPDELALFIQEAQSGSHSDTASILTSTTALSDPTPSLWDSGSVRSFSDTSSITGSIISNVTSKTARLLKGRSSTSSHAIQTATEQQQLKQEAAWLNEPATSQAQSDAVSLAGSSKEPKKQGAFMCGFCKEEDMVKTCTRKNDLKRHIEDFHNVNAQWHCRQRGCQKIFDWQAAYKQHLKSAHGGSRMSLDEAKVNLCPQVVFACGFENCLQVFEASGDNDSPAIFKEYVAHVVKHFDEGSNSGDWTYSARMRNLLRQSTVNDVWTETVWNEAARNQLVWHSQSSGILRKRLECRHIGDAKLLVQYAFMLGSDPARITKYSPDFVIPVADTCQMNIPGHKIRSRGAVPPPPEPDPFQFRISRGNNPALQALLASQRRVYVPPRGSNRPMTAVARPHQLHSARSTSHLPSAGQHHHHHHMPTAPTSNPMSQTPYFTAMPEPQVPPPPPPAPPSPLFDPLTTQPFNPATTMMPQVSLMQDDLQSLRSMGSNTPEPDIEMSDGPLLHPDYSSSFPHAGMHTPPPSDSLPSPAMGHHHDFYHHEEPHAF